MFYSMSCSNCFNMMGLFLFVGLWDNIHNPFFFRVFFFFFSTVSIDSFGYKSQGCLFFFKSFVEKLNPFLHNITTTTSKSQNIIQNQTSKSQIHAKWNTQTTHGTTHEYVNTWERVKIWKGVWMVKKKEKNINKNLGNMR